MKVLLLQDQVYLPSLGGGNKSNRLLLEHLAARGHECRAFAPALTTRAGPTTYAELAIEVARRGARLRSSAPDRFDYDHRGVRVELTGARAARAIHEQAADTIARWQPEWVLVSDDKRRILLDAAIGHGADRVLQIVQTVVHLPFGPFSYRTSRRQTSLMRRARRVVAISEFVRRYLERHGGIDAVVARLPVYGTGPFAQAGNFSRGFLTMINPCAEKGIDIFLDLAARLPHERFAAVPTWGTDDAAIRALASRPNVDILPPDDAVDTILGKTRVLLVPSLWTETFGYVVVEAMLRGIPVLASDIGGLPEAKLGVDYLLPVRAAERHEGRVRIPSQDTAPWLRALNDLLSDRGRYESCAARSRAAAQEFLRSCERDCVSGLLESMEVASR